MTFDEWKKKWGAVNYIDTYDDERAARVGWEAAMVHAFLPEVRDGEAVALLRRWFDLNTGTTHDERVKLDDETEQFLKLCAPQ